MQPYLELKLAWEMFQKPPEVLSEPERQRVAEIAGRQDGIEQRILHSAEAASVVVPATTLASRVDEVRGRYASPAELARDLEHLGLDASQLAEAIERDLRVEAVLDKVAAAVPEASVVDAEIYYHLHPEAFDRPEARRLRHILITHDDARGKAKASATLASLRSTTTDGEKFAAAALRHSQCPTAMDGGRLGTVRRGQLFPELEPAAFALQAGELSAVLASPIGLHLLYCEEILPDGPLPFAEVCPRIIERLTDKRRSEAQRDWIRAQPRPPARAHRHPE
ncbi:MAG: nitrogen fixation protein NifM [Betaproteobacteria bacterium]|nr:nitrogen fixation protein NifM [Betaproteobacteria bacterium]